MKPYNYTFTVFTPTFNRAHELENVYNCLLAQTYNNFEWLIVDDGSTDKTRKLIEKWRKAGRLDIQYYYQKNMGLHAAINHGVREARGELFLKLDSDDVCEPNALERFIFHWNNIPYKKRNEYSAVTALCKDENGNIIGDKFKNDIFDSDSIEIHTRYRIKGQKWGFHRTDILKKYPFPVFKTEKRVPSSLIWNRIALKYKTRFINEALKIYEIKQDSISQDIVKARMLSPKGTTLYYNEYMSLPVDYRARIKSCINYIRFSLHGGNNLFSIIGSSKKTVLTFFLFVFGFFIFISDRIRYR